MCMHMIISGTDIVHVEMTKILKFYQTTYLETKKRLVSINLNKCKISALVEKPPAVIGSYLEKSSDY